MSVAIDPIPFKLACYEDMHNILDEFEIFPDWTMDYRIICPGMSKRYPDNLEMKVSALFLSGFSSSPFYTCR